jgi:hypothetical protein
LKGSDREKQIYSTQLNRGNNVNSTIQKGFD